MVCVLAVKARPLRVGERIHIVGKEADFMQKVSSLQVESVNVAIAQKGQLVGLKVDKAVREGDKIFWAEG